MDEGWYLMSTPELEALLRAIREDRVPPDGLVRLDMNDALAYRNGGNVPDEEGRSLRLVLHVEEGVDLAEKRLRFEPDFHDAPSWRTEASKPVNVVPLRLRPATSSSSPLPWWEEPDMARLEEEWSRTGAAAGIRVPAEFRSFAFKTIAALQRSGLEVTVDRVADSISRWLTAADAERIRTTLQEANAKEPGT